MQEVQLSENQARKVFIDKVDTTLLDFASAKGYIVNIKLLSAGVLSFTKDGFFLRSYENNIAHLLKYYKLRVRV